MSQELDFSEFRRVFENLEGVRDQIPEIKREFLDGLGGKMLSTVRGGIGGEGKVQSWQEYFVGSGGGYTAVRAKAETYQYTKKAYQCTQREKYAVGWITNSIENGHRIRSPSGQQKGRYRPRIRNPGGVQGRHFYKASQAAVDNFVKAGATELAEKIARTIEMEMKK